MKAKDLTPQQKKELEKFGANTWFVEYLHKQYLEDPSEVPDQWKTFFGKEDGKKGNGKSSNKSQNNLFENINYPVPGDDEETQVIAGALQRSSKI
jgi:2-oxoglutarate dehydrogenase complex dehydrogenase (E1) component-like enzyme